MASVQGIFKIRRYWLRYDTPDAVLATLNYRRGTHMDVNQHNGPYQGAGRAYYVDINYYGDSARNLTLMELKYADYIFDRQEITYVVEGDDGLDIPDLTSE